MRNLVEILDVQAHKIEVEKLKAIGQRNRVEAEGDNRLECEGAGEGEGKEAVRMQ